MIFRANVGLEVSAHAPFFSALLKGSNAEMFLAIPLSIVMHS